MNADKQWCFQPSAKWQCGKTWFDTAVTRCRITDLLQRWHLSVLQRIPGKRYENINAESNGSFILPSSPNPSRRLHRLLHLALHPHLLDPIPLHLRTRQPALRNPRLHLLHDFLHTPISRLKLRQHKITRPIRGTHHTPLQQRTIRKLEPPEPHEPFHAPKPLSQILCKPQQELSFLALYRRERDAGEFEVRSGIAGGRVRGGGRGELCVEADVESTVGVVFIEELLRKGSVGDGLEIRVCGVGQGGEFVGY